MIREKQKAGKEEVVLEGRAYQSPQVEKDGHAVT